MPRILLLPVVWLMLFGVTNAQQLSNSLSIDGGVSRMKPESTTETGWYAFLHWNVGLGKGFFFSPHIGMDQVKDSGGTNFQLYQIGFGGKYYLTDRFSFRLSGNFSLVDDVWSEQTLDVYPSFSIAYDLPLAKQHSLSLTLRDDLTGALTSPRPFRNLVAFGIAYTFWYGN